MCSLELVSGRLQSMTSRKPDAKTDNPQSIYKTMLKKATRISQDTTKAKFARIYGNEIKIATKTADYESERETLWRYLVVRCVIDKTKTKKVKFIPKKYLPIGGA